jgi:hypothetical protein
MYVPGRFRDELSLHMVRNLRPTPDPGTALILGIHGPPGEGKTYQTEMILRDAGVQTILVSGGELESGEAGEPSRIVRDKYLQAGVYRSNGIPAVLLLNDADAALGSWGEMTQYTVNTQNVVTELMHLADYPTRVEGQTTPRVPIVITGNDFSRLYGPLCRPGRMNLFRWVLTDEERMPIVGPLFPFLSAPELGEVFANHPGRSVAFWAAVRGEIDRQRMLDIVKSHPLNDLLQHLVRGGDVRPGGAHEATLEDVHLSAKSLLAHQDTVHL